jgi:hypothetical protein
MLVVVFFLARVSRHLVPSSIRFSATRSRLCLRRLHIHYSCHLIFQNFRPKTFRVNIGQIYKHIRLKKILFIHQFRPKLFHKIDFFNCACHLMAVFFKKKKSSAFRREFAPMLRLGANSAGRQHSLGWKISVGTSFCLASFKKTEVHS